MSDGASDGVSDGARITLLSKPGCQLCDEARAVIERVAADTGVTWDEVDVSGDGELLSKWWEQLPVTLIDGVQHDYWRVDEARLRKALAGTRRGDHSGGPQDLGR